MYYCSWLVGDIDRDVIEIEVSRSAVGHIDHADPEIGVAEVGCTPSMPPGIVVTTKDVATYNSAQGWGLLSNCPCAATVPRDLNADPGAIIGTIYPRIKADFNALDHSASRHIEIEIMEGVLVLAVISAGSVRVRTTVQVNSKEAVIDINAGRVGLITIVITCIGSLRRVR